MSSAVEKRAIPRTELNDYAYMLEANSDPRQPVTVLPWTAGDVVTFDGNEYVILDFDADDSMPEGATAILISLHRRVQLRMVPLSCLNRDESEAR